MKILVCGAGGFIGGHIAKRLLENGHEVRCVDIKDTVHWFQKFDKAENLSLDLKLNENCSKVLEDCDSVINLACNMGGMGFIHSYKTECMLSVLVNTNLLVNCKKMGIKDYFYSSSACVYNQEIQSETFIKGLKEKDAYPAMPEDGYGWEKLFSERMCNHFNMDYGLKTKVARYHNIYGPIGTFDGGREKAPAALCRKIAIAKLQKSKEIEIWGDGEQTRSFLFIDDCVDATLKLTNSTFNLPLNIGSEEQVSINQMVDIIEEIAQVRIKRKYLMDKPMGVRGRNSDNTLIDKNLDWKPKYNLREGLEKTYQWIFDTLSSNDKKIIKKFSYF